MSGKLLAALRGRLPTLDVSLLKALGSGTSVTSQRLVSDSSGDASQQNTETLPQTRPDDHHGYDAYLNWDYEQPYMKRKLWRYGNYNPKHYQGGMLPRPEINKTHLAEPCPKPTVDPYLDDPWAPEKALAGQNDYIDILGDGSVQPWETIDAPEWLRGFRGNEFARLHSRFKFEGRWLREHRPLEYEAKRKRMRFLFKLYNLRRRFRHDHLRNSDLEKYRRRASGGRFSSLDWGP